MWATHIVDFPPGVHVPNSADDGLWRQVTITDGSPAGKNVVIVDDLVQVRLYRYRFGRPVTSDTGGQGRGRVRTQVFVKTQSKGAERFY